MADTSDEILRTYIDTVLRLQQERDEHAWSDSDLQQAALEAGMTDTDMAHIRQHLHDCINRGEGFIRYENWDDAIRELGHAQALAPNNVAILNALATAYSGRWNRDGEKEDHAQALRRAERVLRLDSRNDTALRIVSALRTNRAELLGGKAGSPSRGSRPALILGVTLAALVLGLVMFLAPSGDPEPVRQATPPPPPQAPSPPELPAPPATPEPARPGAADAGAALTFGREGNGPGLFTDARTIAVDGAGDVYVADYSDGRIQVFDSMGNYLRQWSVGKNHYVKGLAADRGGTVYVVHSGRIHRYEGKTGKLLGELKYGGGPGFVDVAVMADGGLAAAWDGLWKGGLFVNPKSQDNLVIFNAAMKAVRTVRNPISAVSGGVEFSPRVAVDGLGSFYMLGESGKAIYHFTPEGKFVDKFGGIGEKPEGLHGARGIAVNGRGNVFVTDFSGVHEFDSDGRHIRSTELRGSADALAFNTRDELYVVARTRVVKFPARQ